MRDDRWKLHLGKPSRLFDLDNDLAEQHDVVANTPENVQRLANQAQGI